MIAAVNASALTGSRTPPPYNPIPPHSDRPSTSLIPPFATSSHIPTPNHPPASHHCPPRNPPWEDGSSDEEFTLRLHSNHRSPVGIHHSSRLKADIPMFYGLTNNEAFVDWVADVDDYFTYVPVDENATAQLVALRLKGCAKAWWRQTQSNRTQKRKGPILLWRKMKSLMYERFLPADYQRALFTEYLNCRQGPRSVDDYADDFHRLVARSELKEGEEQMIAWFIAGLRIPIQDRVSVLSTYSLADSMNRASQIEKQLSRSSRSPAYPQPARNDPPAHTPPR